MISLLSLINRFLKSSDELLIKTKIRAYSGIIRWILLKRVKPDLISKELFYFVQCTQKHRFKTEDATLESISKMKVKKERNKLRTYYCRFCQGWHKTSKEPNAKAHYAIGAVRVREVVQSKTDAGSGS